MIHPRLLLVRSVSCGYGWVRPAGGLGEWLYTVNSQVVADRSEIFRESFRRDVVPATDEDNRETNVSSRSPPQWACGFNSTSRRTEISSVIFGLHHRFPHQVTAGDSIKYNICNTNNLLHVLYLILSQVVAV